MGIPDMMDAAVLKGGNNTRSRSDLSYTQVKTPMPSDNEVLVQVYACGFCQTDLKAITGKRTLPITDNHIVGHEPAGVIAAVGKNVNGFKVGDAVAVSPLAYCGECSECREGDEFTHYCKNAIVYGGDGPPTVKNGAFAQYMAVDEKSVYLIPEGVSFERAALLEPTAGSWKGQYNSNMQAGEDVVVIGVGGIGAILALLVKYIGAGRVVAVDTSNSALNRIKGLGIDYTVLNEQHIDFEELTAKTTWKAADEVYEILGKQPDLIFESAGPPQAVSLLYDILLRGRGIKANIFGITTHEGIPVDHGKLHFAEPKITSSFNVSRLSLEQAMSAIESGFDPSRIVTHRFPLDHIDDAVDMMGKPDRGKLIIHPNPNLYPQQ